MNLEKARLTAYLSQIVYNDEDECLEAMRARGLNDCNFFDVDHAQGAAGLLDDGTAVFVFRGTEPDKLSDIAADLKFWKDEAELGGRIHEGFQDEMDKLWPEIEQFIQDSGATTFIVCGHSLGGAMATVCASRLPNATVYTYGSPRVGNRKFARLFNNKYICYRFVNNNDIVTRVPLPLMFKHVGHLFYITSNGKLIDNPSQLRILQGWLKGYWAALKQFKLLDAVSDHDIGAYVKAVENA